MKATTALAFLSLTLVYPPVTYADTFGSGANAFDIEFVSIGNPGNVADDANAAPDFAGSVPYAYRIGKFEISELMVDNANALGGLGISRSNRGPNKPATNVNWNEAARFVNWLNTSRGGVPAYKFAIQPGEPGYDANADIELWTSNDIGYNPANPLRNTQARYFLPNFNEWYKAAYYDPATDTYFNFPNGGNTAPVAVAGGTVAGTAVYSTFPSGLLDGPADIENAGGLSPNGTMAQAGNVEEWEESTFWRRIDDDPSTIRGVRGGYWRSFTSSGLSAMSRGYGIPAFESTIIGFRVASIPEPSTLLLIGIASFGLMFRNPR